MGFLYNLLLKLLYPTSVSLLLLFVAAIAGKRKRLRRWSFALAILVLLVCGNGYVVGALTHRLERQYAGTVPVPAADAILVLSGGIVGRTPPRPTVEVGDSGDRVLYGAELFRQGRAPLIFVTGGIATGGLPTRPASEDMAELLRMVGLPQASIVIETKSENTYGHAVNVCPMFEARQIRSVLLVTSAMHMPRSMGVFRRHCPGLTVIAAPTDFRVTEEARGPWYREIVNFLPTPRTLVNFSDAAHEYVGLLYYKLRGWI